MTLQTPDANKQLVRKIYDSINGRRTQAILELVAPDYDDGQGGRGPSAFARNLDELLAGFPDVHFTIEDLIAEGDRVVIRWTWEATHTGRFKSWGPTGRRITNSGIAIYRIRDGKVIRVWLETDRLGALQQMGVLPAPAPAPQPATR